MKRYSDHLARWKFFSRGKEISAAALVGTAMLAVVSVSTAAETTRELLDAARWEVRVFSFDNAHKLYRRALEQSEEGSAEWQEALFGAAITVHHMVPPDVKKLAQAEELYRRLIDRTPQSRFVPRAMMNLGRLAELRDFHDDKVDLEQARRWYQKVVDGWPNDRLAGEATFRIASTYVQTYETEQVKRGVRILEDWLAKHPDDPMASGMWQYLGDTYFYPLEDYRRSLDCYIRADTIGLLEKGREGPVYWRMAVIADRYLQDRDMAVKYYTKIITLVPTSGKAYEAQLALQRLGAPVPKLEMFGEMTGAVTPDSRAAASAPPSQTKQNPEGKNRPAPAGHSPSPEARP